MTPGIYILEELQARGLTLEDLRKYLARFDPMDRAELMEFLDGRRPVTPIVRDLANFFGTSTVLWEGLERSCRAARLKQEVMRDASGGIEDAQESLGKERG